MSDRTTRRGFPDISLVRYPFASRRIGALVGRAGERFRRRLRARPARSEIGDVSGEHLDVGVDALEECPRAAPVRLQIYAQASDVAAHDGEFAFHVAAHTGDISAHGVDSPRTLANSRSMSARPLANPWFIAASSRSILEPSSSMACVVSTSMTTNPILASSACPASMRMQPFVMRNAFRAKSVSRVGTRYHSADGRVEPVGVAGVAIHAPPSQQRHRCGSEAHTDRCLLDKHKSKRGSDDSLCNGCKKYA